MEKTIKNSGRIRVEDLRTGKKQPSVNSKKNNEGKNNNLRLTTGVRG